MIKNELNEYYMLIIQYKNTEIKSDRLYDIYDAKRIAMAYLKQSKQNYVFRVDVRDGHKVQYELVNNKYIRLLPGYYKSSVEKIFEQVDNGFICYNETDNPKEFEILKNLVYTKLHK